MKPLFIFETPNASKNSLTLLEERVINVVIPALKSISYDYAFQKIEELHSGIVLQINKARQPLSILAVPWVRPANLSKSNEQILADYPRLAVPKQLKYVSDEEKIKKLYELTAKYQLYFLVVMQRMNGENLYWLDRYDSIPIEEWKLTYRKDKNNLDRVHFPTYTKYKFVKIKDLQKQLNSIYYG